VDLESESWPAHSIANGLRGSHQDALHDELLLGADKEYGKESRGESGEPATGGGRSFPTPEALASVSEKFYRDEIRAGYRSPYFVEIAEAIASGKVDPESWLTTDIPTDELKKEIKSLKGFGDYAADNLLKLLGRYNGLALDSWLRSQFYKKHNREKVCADKKIERHYTKFGSWKGLAIWCDMTERWFDEKLLS
jgi:N-glycosylase/DNA lyase